MNKLLIILFSFLLVGCGNYGKTLDEKPNASITYFKDEKTQLCFAQYGSITKDGFAVVSISNVPCEKVERFLIK